MFRDMWTRYDAATATTLQRLVASAYDAIIFCRAMGRKLGRYSLRQWVATGRFYSGN